MDQPPITPTSYPTVTVSAELCTRLHNAQITLGVRLVRPPPPVAPRVPTPRVPHARQSLLCAPHPPAPHNEAPESGMAH